MADITGLLSQALPLAQGIMEAGTGLGSPGYPLQARRFMEQKRRHQQMMEFARSMGVPEDQIAKLPEEATMQDVMPQRQITSQGQVITAKPFGGPISAQHIEGFQAPPPKLPTDPVSSLAISMAMRDLPPGTMPTEAQWRQYVPAATRAIGNEKIRERQAGRAPQRDRLAFDKETNEVIDLDTGQRRPMGGGAVSTGGQPTSPPPGMPKDLLKSVNSDKRTWRLPDGSIADGTLPQWKALQQGAVPMKADDDQTYQGLIKVRQTAKEMLDLLPPAQGVPPGKEGEFVPREVMTGAPGLGDIATQYLGQVYQGKKMEIKSRTNKPLAKYMSKMRDLQITNMRKTLGKGRLPVYDQQLLLDKTVSPMQDLETQRSQLMGIVDEADRQAKAALDYQRATVGKNIAPPVVQQGGGSTQPPPGPAPAGATHWSPSRGYMDDQGNPVK